MRLSIILVTTMLAFNLILSCGCSEPFVPTMPKEPMDSIDYNLLWEVPINEDTTIVSEPFLTKLYQDQILVERDVLGLSPSRAELLSLDAASGDYLWYWNANETISSLANRPVFDDSNFFIAAGNNYHSLDLSSGGSNWSLDYSDSDGGNIYSFLNLDSDRLVGVVRYGISEIYNNKIVFIDKNNGLINELFTVGLDNDGFTKSVEFVKPYKDSSNNQMLLIGIVKTKNSPFELKSSLINYNLDSNSTVWEVTEINDAIMSTSIPIIENDHLYVLNFKGMTCFNINSGDVIWDKIYNNIRFLGNHLITGSSVIFGSSTGNVIALDKNSGVELFNKSFGPNVSNINYFDNKLFFCNSKLRILSAETGDILHELESKNDNIGSNCFFNNRVAINEVDSIMYVQDNYFVQAIKIPN